MEHTTLPCGNDAPGRARRWAVDHARFWGCADGALEELALVVSELVTNAVMHALTEVTVSLERRAGDVIGAVRDSRPDARVPLEGVRPDVGGRGLRIVRALAREVAVSYDTSSKTVSFALACYR